MHTYTAGRFLAVVGESSVALLDPSLGIDDARRMWELDQDGNRLGRWIELLAARGISNLPPFALIEARADGLFVIVRGEATVRAGDREVTGRGYSTWYEELVPGASSFTITAPRAADGDELPIATGIVYADRIVSAEVASSDDDQRAGLAVAEAEAADEQATSVEQAPSAGQATNDEPTDSDADPAPGMGADAAPVVAGVVGLGAAGVAAGATLAGDGSDNDAAPGEGDAPAGADAPTGAAPDYLSTDVDASGEPDADDREDVAADEPEAGEAPAPSTADTDEYEIDAVAGQHDGEDALGLTEEPDARDGYEGEHGYGASDESAEDEPAGDEPTGRPAADSSVPVASEPEGLVDNVPAGVADAHPAGGATADDDIVDAVPTFDAEATQVHADDDAYGDDQRSDSVDDSGFAGVDGRTEDRADGAPSDWASPAPYGAQPDGAQYGAPAYGPRDDDQPQYGQQDAGQQDGEQQYGEQVADPQAYGQQDEGAAAYGQQQYGRPDTDQQQLGAPYDGQQTDGEQPYGGDSTPTGDFPTSAGAAGAYGQPEAYGQPGGYGQSDAGGVAPGETFAESDPLDQATTGQHGVGDYSASGLAIILTDGTTIVVDRPILLGRAPDAARFTGEDVPRLVQVRSPERDVSATHVEVRPAGDTVVVTDMDSTNGTVIVLPDQPAFRLHPRTGVPVPAGAYVELGTDAGFHVDLLGQVPAQ
jgi:hypothetical protein